MHLPPDRLRRAASAVLLLSIACAVVVRLRFANLPLERDEGEFAYAGQLLLRGIAPYRFAYSLKFPGVYAAYAALLALLGESAVAVHIGLLVANLVTVGLLFLWVRRRLGGEAGLVAAAAYATLAASPAVFGLAAHATQFVVLCTLGGLVFLDGSRGRPPVLVASGLAFGLALLMKQPGLAFGLWGAFLLARRERRDGWTSASRGRLALFLGALALPMLVSAGLLAHAGVFRSFWFWTVSYAHEYGRLISVEEGLRTLGQNGGRVVAAAPLLFGLAAIGLWALRGDERLRGDAGCYVGLVVASFAALAPGLYFREHYFVVALPAVAVLVAAGVAALQRRGLGDWAVAVAGLATFLAWHQGLGFFGASLAEASRRTYGGAPFVEAVVVGDHLRNAAHPGDRLAVLGSEPEIYFYSGLRSATGYLYTFPLMEPQRYAADMQEEMIREIEQAAPRFLVIVNEPGSWFIRPSSSTRIFEWSSAFAEKHYQLVGRVEKPPTGVADYAWGEAARARRPATRDYLLVYERR